MLLHKLLYHLFLVQSVYQGQEYYFFLLLPCEELLKSTSKIITFLPNPLPPNENSPFLSNQIS